MSTHPLVNQYTGKTANTPRPERVREQPEWWDKTDERLIEAQGLWDEAQTRDDALAPHRETIEKRLGSPLATLGPRTAVHDQQRRYRIEEAILAEAAAA